MIYLDYQATTPMAPEAWTAMQAWLDPAQTASFANPHSAHAPGRAAAAAIGVARDQIATLLPPGGRVIFTSGATEAINLAIGGGLPFVPQNGRDQIITLATEHAAVLDMVHAMAMQGYQAVVLPVQADGIVDLDNVRKTINNRTALVAIMQVNNEIGVIQPIDDIAALARSADVPFLCDASQSYGRFAVPQSADMIAVSAHKIHGPKGVGALWMRDGFPLSAMMHGGGQEAGLRSGTLSPALCAGFGAAAAVARTNMAADSAHVRAVWDVVTSYFAGMADGWIINGSTTDRYYGNINLRRDGLDMARLMSDARGVAFSAGSACASGSGRPSHVLAALGLTQARTKTAIRLGWGRYTNIDDAHTACQTIKIASQEQGINI